MPEVITRRLRLNSKQIWYGFLGILLVVVIVNNVRDQLSSPIAIKYSDADIAFASMRYLESRYPVYLVNTANGNERPVLGTTFGGTISSLTWAPDGQTLALEGIMTMGISKFDPRYGSEGIIFVDARGDTSPFKPCSYSPAWSPDGDYLAYQYDCSNRGTRTEKTASLSVARLDGSDTREVVTGIEWRWDENGRGQPIRISWSRDGRYLAFDNPDASVWFIWTVTNNGDQLHKLTQGHHPAWSPISNEIAFARDDTLWIINLDDGTERALKTPDILADWPSWSPDGTRIALEGIQDKNSDIYMINLDGSNLTRLTRDQAGDWYPAWRPASDQ